MKLGITTNVFAGPLKSREVTLEAILGLAAGLGMGSVEIRDDDASLDEARVRSLASVAKERGLALSYGIKNDMMSGGDRDLFERGVRLASLCGRSTVLRMLASQDALRKAGKRGYSLADLEALKATLEAYGGVASASGVLLALENAREPLYGGEGYFGMADLISGAKPGDIGLTFDPANATTTSLCKSPSGEEEVLRFVDEFAPRVFITHYKTTKAGVVEASIGDADVDNGKLLQTLSGPYRGVLCVEIPGSPTLKETAASVQTSLDYLRAKGLYRYLR